MKDKEIQRLIRKGKRQVREGKVVSWEEVKRNLKDLAKVEARRREPARLLRNHIAKRSQGNSFHNPVQSEIPNRQSAIPFSCSICYNEPTLTFDRILEPPMPHAALSPFRKYLFLNKLRKLW